MQFLVDQCTRAPPSGCRRRFVVFLDCHTASDGQPPPPIRREILTTALFRPQLSPSASVSTLLCSVAALGRPSADCDTAPCQPMGAALRQALEGQSTTRLRLGRPQAVAVGPRVCASGEGGKAAPRRRRADNDMENRVRACPMHRRGDPPPPWYQGGGGGTADSFLVGPTKARRRLYPRQHEWPRPPSTLDVAAP